jgi:hypothetical protein
MDVFEIEHNKALVWMIFPLNFTNFFWDIVKQELMSLFNEFHAGRLPIHSLNFGVITLLPKVAEAAGIQQYNPICLLNVT